MQPHDPESTPTPSDPTPESAVGPGAQTPAEDARPPVEPVRDLAAGTDAGYASPPAPVAVSGPRRQGGFVVAVALAIVAILGGGALFLSGYMLGQRGAAQPGTPATDEAAFQPFWDTYQAIRDRYALGPVDRQVLIEGAIKGLVEAVGDPYSSYLTSEEFRGTLQDISGEFEGIGAEIGTVDANRKTVDCSKFAPDCRLVIVSPIAGSPAEKAGLKPGDIIVAVDGSTVDGLTPDEARDKIRGKKGTDVKLLIDREGVAQFEVTITRDVIQRQEIETKDLAGGTIAYIRLNGFSDNGAKQFDAALKAAVDKGVKKVVVDLRGNPGGFITAARDIASDFIASGPVFWEEDAKGNQTPTEALPNGVATDPSIQVVVLIDKGSASASEIVAGALQDTKRATLVGQTSYGKGTVQQWIELGQGGDAGGLKLTIAKWLTPDKRWIHKVGLTPDVPVEVPSDTPAGSDPALDKAVEILAGSALAPAAHLKAA